jgi:hypothetical protein
MSTAEPSPPKPSIDPIVARQLALKHSIDVRTLQRALRGEPVRGLAGHRAKEALREAGLKP